MKFSKNGIARAAAISALLLNTLSPAVFAAESLQVVGNGSSSVNNVKVDLTHTTTVTQSNEAYVSNDVEVNSSTGENSANDNTGGDVVILTGSALSNVNLDTKVNLNRADLGRCATCNGDTEVLVSGNGFGSENEVDLSKDTENQVFQDNKAQIHNDVDVKTKTGENDANRNTGGSTAVVTGNAESNVTVENAANANIARVGTPSGAAGSSLLRARILDNGSSSDNDIDVDLNRSNLVVQDNKAQIHNDVDVKTKTGENSANDNTGGDVLVDTGRSLGNVTIDNLANFNFAAADCGCYTTVDAKVAGNGFESENEVEAEIVNDLAVYQDNRSDLRNELENKVDTGENWANRNTEGAGGDPTIVTGHSSQNSTVSNAANVNTSGASLDLPNGLTLNLGFDLGALLGILH